jgi:hypothetical protein
MGAPPRQILDDGGLLPYNSGYDPVVRCHDTTPRRPAMNFLRVPRRLVHFTLFLAALGALLTAGAGCLAADNTLSDKEKAEGWVLLFDGKTTNGWITNGGKPVPDHRLQGGALNPHDSGGYLIVHEQRFGNFVFACDFKLSKGCNSGIFFRTADLDDVVQTGIELAIDDTTGHGKHDTGAVYDLVAPKRNATKPAGQWNHVELTCDGNLITVAVNGEEVTKMDLDQWTEPGKNPDGTRNKFQTAYKDMPREGHLGFQDHGQDCWFKNIKVKELK